ncbi:MAG: branched-chain amino acid ABC transporter permease [Myxococcales bacterium]|nr:branched-chain amino acid ABC transporter permease [Myxococcales bacterium]
MRRALVWMGVLGLLVAFQFAAGAVLSEYVIRVVSMCALNVMLAVALNLVNGTTGQFSIGHAGFMAVGAYAGAITSHALDGRLGASLGPVTLVIACAAGALAAGVAGVLVGAPSLRLRGDYLAIVTLGFGEIIRISIESIGVLGGSQGYPMGADSIPPYAGVGWMVGGAVLVTVLLWHLTYSSYGRALSAIREDEIAAEAAGIPTTRYKVLAFTVSAMATGLAGVLFAHDATGGQHIDPAGFNLNRSVDMLVMIIFGGLGSLSGAVLGGIFVAVSLEALREFQGYRLIAYALLLVGLMLLRPQGLLGTRELSVSMLKRLVPGRREGGA